MRTAIYVDGFNLYYRALKGTPYKWLNLEALARHMLRPTNQITAVKYFTARVSARPNDPDQPVRQDFDVAVVITSDSDLWEPIRIVAQELKLPVGVFYPGKHLSRSLNELMRLTGVSYPTANKMILALEALGIVHELTGQQRNRVFVYNRYLMILNEGTEPL
jgi:predicted transcriptional regulator